MNFEASIHVEVVEIVADFHELKKGAPSPFQTDMSGTNKAKQDDNECSTCKS